MKPTVKIVSLLLAVMMLFTAIMSGCSISKEWSYKTSDKELAIGVYIYALYNAYSRAQSYAEKLDDYDSTKDTWLDKEITDDDGNTEVASKWIKDQAQLICLEILAVEQELKRLNATADEAMVSNLDSAADSNWNFGTTYTQYIGYVQPLKTTLEPYGISYDSFKLVTSTFVANEDKLFEAIYLEGGEQEVSKDEIKKYFDENYVRYSYLPVQLYTSTTDEAGTSSNVAMSDADVKKITDEFEGYAKQVNAASNASETSSKLLSEYLTANGQDESSIVTNTAKKDETNAGEELEKAINDLGEGKATTLKVGEGENATLYYVFRYTQKEAEDDYLNDTNKTAIVSKMKEKDFTAYMKELADKLDYQKNGAVDRYDPKMFFVAKEPETTAATTNP